MSNKVYVTVGVDKRTIPEGGDAGQFLVKASDEDYDFVWADVSGTGAERQPSTGVSPKDAYNATKAGVRGTSVNYARQDHSHPCNVPTSGLPQMDGTATIGASDYYAAFDHVHPRNTKNAVAQLSNLTIGKNDWTQVTANQHYTKDVTASITGGTAKSKVDLCAESATLLQMDNDGTLAVYIENSSATFTAHVIGEKPTASLTFQVFRTELA